MSEHEVKIDQPGVYFFAPPICASLRLHQELLVVLTCPTVPGCGFVLHGTNLPARALSGKLDALLARLKSEGAKEGLVAKLFGASYYNELLLLEAYRWLRERQVKLAAQDVGRNVRRHILVNCQTGKVGVRYAEDYGIPVAS